MEGKAVSLFGQNTLVFELFPLDINHTCDNFSSIWAYCGLGHPNLDQYRMGIVVCHLNAKTLYIANNLHCTIHGGISPDMAAKYVNGMLSRGYRIEAPDTFNEKGKHILIIGSNESMVIPNVLSFYNYNTPLFTEEIHDIFHHLDLRDYGKSMLQTMDKRKMKSQHTSRGQPLVLNLSFSIQNCLDDTTIPGMFLPKLTTKDLENIHCHTRDIPISHRMIEMMTDATLFYKSNYDLLQQCKPFINSRRNKLFGNRIGSIINYPNTDIVQQNCFEGMTGGIKTQESFGFCSHVDSHNSHSDTSYSTVMVASEAVSIPANGSIPFGSPTDKMFPFSIFYNRRGCETRCAYEGKGMRWLRDVRIYYDNMPSKLKDMSASLFDINVNMDITHQIKQRRGVKIVHRSPHANKHLQLSSFCDTLIYAQNNIPWWNEYYTVEYLYFVGLICTPVSARFAMMDVLATHSKYPPSKCLTLLLIDSANRTQGGINKASGHRYSPSCGKDMPENFLYLSLRNLYIILQESRHNNDTALVVKKISHHPIRGGVFKVGPLSAYEVLSIYTMSTKGGNIAHVKNAVIAKNNNASKFLEQKYGITPTQQEKLLALAKQHEPDMESHIVENVSCKRSYDKNEKKSNRCDTTFSDQEYLVYLQKNNIHTLDRKGNFQLIEDVLTGSLAGNEMTERVTMRWFDMEIKDLQNMSGLDEIKFVSEYSSSLDTIINIHTRSMNHNKGDEAEEKNMVQLGKRKKQSKKERLVKEDIYTTEYGSRSMEYIVKRSGLYARQVGKNREKKQRKMKQRKIDLEEDYVDNPKRMKTLNPPNYITLVDKTTQKHIDFKTMASMLLGITYGDLMQSIKFTVSPESNEVVYWDVEFENDVLGIQVSLGDIDFCFDTTHYEKKETSKSMLYRTKTAALRHLLLKIILVVKPNIIHEWMVKYGHRPIVVHENCHGQLSDKVEYINGKKGSQRFGLHGWFVLFEHKKKVYGCDMSMLSFDDKGRCIIEKERKEFIYCFTS